VRRTVVATRVPGVVGRRFDRGRYDAEATIRTFSVRLRNEVDLGTLGMEIVDTTIASVRPAAVGLWLREGPIS
jgi:hypothetical protein